MPSEASAFGGVDVRKGAPAEIVDLLNREINAASADRKIQARLDDLARNDERHSAGLPTG